MDPQQELFTRLFIDIKKLGYEVYDGFIPPEDTPYPFVYLADNNSVDAVNKSAVFGTVYQTIHVWSNNPKKRGTVSGMLLAIKTVSRAIEHTNNFAWDLVRVNQRILSDGTTKTPLLHGILELEFKFS